MAAKRDRPYAQFNFLVNIQGVVDEKTVEAGFQEVSGLGLEINMGEYRAGNWALNSTIKINGTFKVPDVTLKRGVIGARDLFDWLNDIKSGKQDARKSVIIKLQDETRTETIQSWKLSEARPIKYTGPALNGKGNDVAIEELVLACENIEMSVQ